MGIPTTIRFVAADDFSQWVILWEGYNRFYGRFDATALPAKITESTWSRFLDAHEPMYALVAEAHGELVGLAHFLFHRSTIMVNHTCYLQDLFTSETCRGKGVGGALIRAVGEQAKKAGSDRVYWQTHESNSNAMKLYDKVAQRSGFLVYRKDV
jgi:GNAT superfamily N-acetyltransferase